MNFLSLEKLPDVCLFRHRFSGRRFVFHQSDPFLRLLVRMRSLNLFRRLKSGKIYRKKQFVVWDGFILRPALHNQAVQATTTIVCGGPLAHGSIQDTLFSLLQRGVVLISVNCVRISMGLMFDESDTHPHPHIDLNRTCPRPCAWVILSSSIVRAK